MEPRLSDLLPRMHYPEYASGGDAATHTEAAAAEASEAAAMGITPPANSGGPRELPAAVKQLLSTELQRELLRRQHGGGEGAGGLASPAALAPSGSPKRRTRPLAPSALAPKALPATAAKAIERRDMFGRVISKGQNTKGQKRGANALGTPAEVRPIRFKFQEGVTDAVRRTVRVRDLL